MTPATYIQLVAVQRPTWSLTEQMLLASQYSSSVRLRIRIRIMMTNTTIGDVERAISRHCRRVQLPRFSIYPIFDQQEASPQK